MISYSRQYFHLDRIAFISAHSQISNNAKISGTSSFVIDMPTGELLAGETKDYLEGIENKRRLQALSI